MQGSLPKKYTFCPWWSSSPSSRAFRRFVHTNFLASVTLDSSPADSFVTVPVQTKKDIFSLILRKFVGLGEHNFKAEVSQSRRVLKGRGGGGGEGRVGCYLVVKKRPNEIANPYFCKGGLIPFVWGQSGQDTYRFVLCGAYSYVRVPFRWNRITLTSIRSLKILFAL